MHSIETLSHMVQLQCLFMENRNTVKYHSSDPVPKFQQISNERGIGKLVASKSKPCSVEMDDRSIRDAFIQFFAKLMSSYKICMNPSSGPSKERFDRNKFVKLILNEKHSVFIELFLQSQLFQVCSGVLFVVCTVFNLLDLNAD